MAVKVGFVGPDARANLAGDKLHNEGGTIKYAYAEIETGLKPPLNLEINRSVYALLTVHINLPRPSVPTSFFCCSTMQKGATLYCFRIGEMI